MSRHDPEIALRQILSHAREAVEILWTIVDHDLPSVIARLEGILNQKTDDR